MRGIALGVAVVAFGLFLIGLGRTPFLDPPEGVSAPANTTMSGKSTFTLFVKVKDLWETITFKTPDGHGIDYSAVIETEQGTVTLALRPKGLTGGKEIAWPGDWSLAWVRRLRARVTRRAVSSTE